ncbi:MAG: hypothetical protein ACFB6S_17705 [Geminicoccaceae bacterium]
MTRSPLLGITVMPEWVQAEGTGKVLEGLERAGANALATSPYVMAPSDDPSASREPPSDAGAGKVRLLDRELWGRRELRFITAPSFSPDFSLYHGLRYQPPQPDQLTEREGGKVEAFLIAAKKAGFDVQLQVQAAIPPGYRVQSGGPVEEDLPRLPDGSTLDGRVDKNASLAAPEIRAYAATLLRDLSRAYPMVDAIRIDWPEYPPYSLDAWFFDFSDHAVRAAKTLGNDIEALRNQALQLIDEPRRLIEEPWEALPGFLELRRFKADLVASFLRHCRDALPPRVRLIAHAFPPPWSTLSGMDFSRISQIADEIAVKLYTMHWPMMLRGYLERIGGEDPEELASRLQQLFDTGDVGLERLRYPEPDEPHPVSTEAQSRKIGAARQLASIGTVQAAAHGYGPLEDFRMRAATAWAASDKRLWINRYGYLSDPKIDVLGALPR